MPHCPAWMRLTRCSLVWAAAAISCNPDISNAQVIAPTRDAAMAALRQRGLVQRGNRWELREEAVLRRRLEQFDRLETELLPARRRVDKLAQENRQRWQQIRVQVGALKKRVASADPKERRAIEKQLATLRQTALPPEVFAESAPVRAVVKELATAELEAAIRLRWTAHTLDDVSQRHAQFASDAEMLALLKTAKGTMKPPVFRDAEQVMAKSRSLLSSAPCWLFRQAGRERIGVLVNQKPSLVTLEKGGEHLLLAASFARGAAVTADRKRQARVLKIEDRPWTVQPIRVARLQIGAVVMEDVPAWQLPTNAEHVGTVLGGYAIPGWQVTPQVERLRAVVSKR